MIAPRRLMMVAALSPALVDLARSAVDGGVDMVHLRDRQASEPDLIDRAARLRKQIDGRAVLIVNGSVTAARRSGAWGVHFPEASTTQDYLRARECGLAVGASVHSVASAIRWSRLGADYLVAGAVYETASHPGSPAGGTALLRSICEAASAVVIAIGGVTVERTAECVDAGAGGVAVLSGLAQAADPAAEAARYRRALDGVSEHDRSSR